LPCSSFYWELYGETLEALNFNESPWYDPNSSNSQLLEVSERREVTLGKLDALSTQRVLLTAPYRAGSNGAPEVEAAHSTAGGCVQLTRGAGR